MEAETLKKEKYTMNQIYFALIKELEPNIGWDDWYFDDLDREKPYSCLKNGELITFPKDFEERKINPINWWKALLGMFGVKDCWKYFGNKRKIEFTKEEAQFIYETVIKFKGPFWKNYVNRTLRGKNSFPFKIEKLWTEECREGKKKPKKNNCELADDKLRKKILNDLNKKCQERDELVKAIKEKEDELDEKREALNREKKGVSMENQAFEDENSELKKLRLKLRFIKSKCSSISANDIVYERLDLLSMKYRLLSKWYHYESTPENYSFVYIKAINISPKAYKAIQHKFPVHSRNLCSSDQNLSHKSRHEELPIIFRKKKKVESSEEICKTLEQTFEEIICEIDETADELKKLFKKRASEEEFKNIESNIDSAIQMDCSWRLKHNPFK